jgi:UDP-glucuronate 4-epimerase
MPPVLLTGVAGFIGYHVAARLLAEGQAVLGVDSLVPYYDVRLKDARLARLEATPSFAFRRLDIADRATMARLFDEARPRQVVHLAAQAGVRHSLSHPEAYVDTNVAGFLNILEGCRRHEAEHLVYASSSSVYGADTSAPFRVDRGASHPLSLYAASKRAGELMAHSYSHLYGLPATGLRFFTAYGPWGRPDMAMFKFARAMLAGDPIEVFNHGAMRRDFTYIDDVVEAVVRVLARPPAPDATWDGQAPNPATSAAPWRLHNVGNACPVALMDMIAVLERVLGLTAEKRFLPMQPGDVPETAADISTLVAATGYAPATPIEIGIPRFVEWYLRHYRHQVRE